MLSHGISNDLLNRSLIISIPKDKRKSLCNSNNYRGISLSTIFNKLFEYIILEKIKSSISSENCQFGFKDKHSTSLCSALLNQTIQYYINGGSNVFVLFLDASKAFDRVKHNVLFDFLINRGVCPLYTRLLYIMYSLNNATVKWKNNESEFLHDKWYQARWNSQSLFICIIFRPPS